jgi:hypothetical protein
LLKSIVLAAMLMALAQTAPPLPRQVSDGSASAPQHNPKNHSGFNQPGAISPPSFAQGVQVTGPSAQGHASKNEGENAYQSITVAKFPTVSVDRDWIDGMMVGLNIGLLIIGYFGVRAAVRTLRAVEKQAHLMQEQLLDSRESGKASNVLAHGGLAAMEAQALALGRQIDVAEQNARDAKQGNADTLAVIKRQGDLMDGQLRAMQAQFFQWIEMLSWESGVPLLEPDKFGVKVSLLNSTNYPLTVKRGSIKLMVAETDGFERSFEDTFLPPNIPATVEIKFPISQSDLVKFTDGYFIIPTRATFQYVGPLGDILMRRQTMWGVLFCKKGKGTEFKVTTHETSDQDPGGQNQN